MVLKMWKISLLTSKKMLLVKNILKTANNNSIYKGIISLSLSHVWLLFTSFNPYAVVTYWLCINKEITYPSDICIHLWLSSNIYMIRSTTYVICISILNAINPKGANTYHKVTPYETLYKSLVVCVESFSHQRYEKDMTKIH